jgi:hypothetical protein
MLAPLMLSQVSASRRMSTAGQGLLSRFVLATIVRRDDVLITFSLRLNVLPANRPITQGTPNHNMLAPLMLSQVSASRRMSTAGQGLLSRKGGRHGTRSPGITSGEPTYCDPLWDFVLATIVRRDDVLIKGGRQCAR